MSTVDQLADRVYRDWLNSPEDQPVIIRLAAALTATATSLTYDSAGLAPDEEDLLAAGILIELDGELARISSVGEGTLTIRRGVSGTDATPHDEGTEIVLAPTFSRHAVVEAVKDNVVHLYPSVWRQDSVALTTASGLVEIPAEAVGSVSFTDALGRPRSISYHDPSPGVASGKAVQFHGVASGTSGYLTYRARFGRPFDEDTELSDYGVREEWERIIVVGATAQVVAGRDLDTLTAEYITEQLQREALPTSAPQQIRNGLLALHGAWLDQARRSLRTEQAPRVTMNV